MKNVILLERAADVRLFFQDPEQTMTDKGVSKIQDKIVKSLERELGAKLRG